MTKKTKKTKLIFDSFRMLAIADTLVIVCISFLTFLGAFLLYSFYSLKIGSMDSISRLVYSALLGTVSSMYLTLKKLKDIKRKDNKEKSKGGRI